MCCKNVWLNVACSEIVGWLRGQQDKKSVKYLPHFCTLRLKNTNSTFYLQYKIHMINCPFVMQSVVLTASSTKPLKMWLHLLRWILIGIYATSSQRCVCHLEGQKHCSTWFVWQNWAPKQRWQVVNLFQVPEMMEGNCSKKLVTILWLPASVFGPWMCTHPVVCKQESYLTDGATD